MTTKTIPEDIKAQLESRGFEPLEIAEGAEVDPRFEIWTGGAVEVQVFYDVKEPPRAREATGMRRPLNYNELMSF